jgi:hypothetical protein
MLIFFLTKRGHGDTIRRYLRSAIGLQYARKVIPVTYEKIFAWMTKDYCWEEAKQSWWEIQEESERPFEFEKLHAGGMLAAQLFKCLFAYRKLPKGVYVFSDLEMLSDEETLKATVLWRTVAESGCGVRILNHPARSMRKYELLRTLYECGINTFNVYRVTEARWPKRYPVFLRFENDHAGARSPLLNTREELDASLLKLEREHNRREEILIIEFCDTADAGGIYRKYGAFMVGGHVFPKNMHFSKQWVVKRTEFSAEEFVREEREYIEANPHADELKGIFALARIEYGRIDYGVLGDAIQVWEINTNPHITTRRENRGGPRLPVYEAVERRIGIALEGLTQD